MSEYTRKVYGMDMAEHEIEYQVTHYILNCRCGLLVKWHKLELGKSEDGMRFFEENCECGVCTEMIETILMYLAIIVYVITGMFVWELHKELPDQPTKPSFKQLLFLPSLLLSIAVVTIIDFIWWDNEK